jgi:hypothetical protein
MTYFPPDTQNGTIDPWPPTIITVNDTDYEYARRYGTLEDPPDLGSIATGTIAIVGVVTSPSFFKSIDILPSIGSTVTQYISVHSEPSDGDDLIKTWHFRADSFASLNSSQYEFGHAFTKSGYSGNSYGFYYGNSVGVASTGTWGVFIDDEVSNYFDDLVLVGRTTPIKINNTVTPIVQIFNNNSKTGLYVQGNTDIGGNLDVDGSGDIGSTLGVGGKLTVRSGGYEVTGNSQITGTLNVTSTVTAPTFIGNVTGTASGNKLISAFDIPHVTKKGRRIRHIVAEGPEPGIYIRGKLTNSNIIELPEYWDGLIDPESITVSLTQIAYSQDLIVDSIEWGKIVKIKSGNGSNINCYYEIWAARWIDPMNHDEKLHVVYDGKTPEDYPGSNKNFLVGGWDYDRRDPEWGLTDH